MPHKGHDHGVAETDDNYVAMSAMEEGHGHSHEKKHGHGHDEMTAEQKNYEASKKKLYLVSFVTVFFIIA